MLIPKQQNFIDRQSDNIIKVLPFDPKANEKFEEIKRQIQSLLGDVEILHRGSTGLEIAGQPEIDVYIPVLAKEIPGLTTELEKVWGKPKSIYPDERTKFIRYVDGTMVEVMLVNKTCESWRDGELFFDYLKNNENARKEYEKLKGVGKELSYKEYYRRKFEFMNHILVKANSKILVSGNISQYFINWVKDLIGNDATVNKEHHGDEGAVYKIDSKGGNYFLKIKMNSTFSKEREHLAWFQGKLPVPKVVNFTEKEGAGGMLLSALPGKNLATLCKEWPVEKIIDKLVDALHEFHKTSTQGWKFNDQDSRKILVHGDACLPNFIFNGDLFSGYIDLADAKLGDPEIDLAAAIWSLGYNLGPGHGSEFLKKYGYYDTTEEMAEKLRLQYVDYQQEHGFL